MNLIFVVVSLSLICQLAEAHELTCENFTQEKKVDCEYIMNAGLGSEDEQLALNALFEQSYNYDEVWTYNIPIQNSVELPKREINAFDIKNLVLASKIFFFGFINYIVFSITKSNIVLKWLSAV